MMNREALSVPEFDQVVSMLKEVLDDQTISRNIRLAADTCIKTLFDDGIEIPVRCDRAIQILNITDDPNINMYTKTVIWQVVSKLESFI